MKTTSLYANFRANVNAQLARRGLTRAELAAVVGCTRPHVTQILGGRKNDITTRTVEKFARGLGVCPVALLRQPK